MKKLIFSLSLFCAISAVAFCQTQSYDSSFRKLYKAVALHPEHRNWRGIIHDSVIRKWDKDIVIFIEGGTSKSRKEITAKLKNTISVVSPALNDKIKISFTDNKSSANYLINLIERGGSGWHIRWDALNNIYDCATLINIKEVFNTEQQARLASHYFLKSLGDFVFTKEAPPVVSSIRLWRQDINDIDLQILKLHYSTDIKPGMAEKDIDDFFLKHNN